ncbi:MAG: hypothetical protein JW832_07630 [Deltaproteobacteria bacterium]|nr:hypothetical protein [Deltaproteobacteria bacterium]
MSDHFCDKCGEYLPEGSLKYSVQIQIISDFDGVILCETDDPGMEAQEMLEAADAMDEQELEDEVYQELSFVLCSRCRKRFSRDPFSRGARTYRTSKNFERIFH